MIVLAGALLGITLGVLTARRRKGSTADLLHYGAIYGIAFALLGLIATLAIDRLTV
ncbi:apolipoprotein acyltransferase [Rhodosalinus halophilus]|jgi:hypothetical protein|uniref:Apolipoprotein acyltransferase n=1 Tax=Rhodosalinus halophilus TaxID=2259333 RepID=A0A365U650_9RHOB|nr:apolipoprotein acyltransferase [Rhodosalinus halophilus]RBI83610.1 apolipoprotein acyltransferase [Rhodosalinus halophilus]